MTKRCLDEGLLQAYIDGELSNESAAEAASHIASCDACATALAEFEGDSAFFAAAFAPDDSISVPTEVLRSRINASVAQLEDALEDRAVEREQPRSRAHDIAFQNGRLLAVQHQHRREQSREARNAVAHQVA